MRERVLEEYVFASMLDRAVWKREHDALISSAKSVHISPVQGGRRRANMIDSVQKGGPEPYPSSFQAIRNLPFPKLT